jgi:hypothetical protein
MSARCGAHIPQQLVVSLCQQQKEKTSLCSQSSSLPGRSDSEDPPQNQTQIERRCMNQRSLRDIILASQMDSPHSAGIIQVSETSLDQLSALP